MFSPVLLQGTVTVSPGIKQELPYGALQNPFKTAMLVDEVRFSYNELSGNSTNIVLQAEMSVGRMQLTNGTVPLRSFGRALNYQDTRTDLCFTWKLPKPLYLSAEELLVISVYFLPGYLVTQRTVTVVVAGRSLPSNFPPPAVVHYPWVTTYIPPYISSADSLDTSQESQLCNPFNEELHVQRFTARYDNMTNSGTDEYSNITEEFTTVRAIDSFGNILVRDPTPLFHLMQAPTRSWTVNARLASKGFYLFTVERFWAAIAAAGSVAISMVGHHDVVRG